MPLYEKNLTKEDDGDIFPTAWLGKRVYTISQTPQVWLDHQVYQEKDELILSWDVVEELFPQDFIGTMFDSMCDVLKQLAINESFWHQTTLDLLPNWQLEQIEQTNQTQTEFPEGLLHSQFFKLAKTHPQAPAIYQDDSLL